jgi:hypothetical protein
MLALLELIIGLDYQQVADMLHTDPYVGWLTVEALHNLIQGKKSNWANILPVRICNDRKELVKKNILLSQRFGIIYIMSTWELQAKLMYLLILLQRMKPMFNLRRH